MSHVASLFSTSPLQGGGALSSSAISTITESTKATAAPSAAPLPSSSSITSGFTVHGDDRMKRHFDDSRVGFVNATTALAEAIDHSLGDPTSPTPPPPPVASSQSGNGESASGGTSVSRSSYKVFASRLPPSSSTGTTHAAASITRMAGFTQQHAKTQSANDSGSSDDSSDLPGSQRASLPPPPPPPPPPTSGSGHSPNGGQQRNPYTYHGPNATCDTWKRRLHEEFKALSKEERQRVVEQEAADSDLLARTVHLRFLPTSMKQSELATICTECGEYLRVRICGNSSNNQNWIYGFVEFATKEGAAALMRKSGMELSNGSGRPPLRLKCNNAKQPIVDRVFHDADTATNTPCIFGLGNFANRTLKDALDSYFNLKAKEAQQGGGGSGGMSPSDSTTTGPYFGGDENADDTGNEMLTVSPTTTNGPTSAQLSPHAKAFQPGGSATSMSNGMTTPNGGLAGATFLPCARNVCGGSGGGAFSDFDETDDSATGITPHGVPAAFTGSEFAVTGSHSLPPPPPPPGSAGLTGNSPSSLIPTPQFMSRQPSQQLQLGVGTPTGNGAAEAAYMAQLFSKQSPDSGDVGIGDETHPLLPPAAVNAHHGLPAPPPSLSPPSSKLSQVHGLHTSANSYLAPSSSAFTMSAMGLSTYGTSMESISAPVTPDMFLLPPPGTTAAGLHGGMPGLGGLDDGSSNPATTASAAAMASQLSLALQNMLHTHSFISGEEVLVRGHTLALRALQQGRDFLSTQHQFYDAMGSLRSLLELLDRYAGLTGGAANSGAGDFNSELPQRVTQLRLLANLMIALLYLSKRCPNDAVPYIHAIVTTCNAIPTTPVLVPPSLMAMMLATAPSQPNPSPPPAAPIGVAAASSPVTPPAGPPVPCVPIGEDTPERAKTSPPSRPDPTSSPAHLVVGWQVDSEEDDAAPGTTTVTTPATNPLFEFLENEPDSLLKAVMECLPEEEEEEQKQKQQPAAHTEEGGLTPPPFTVIAGGDEGCAMQPVPWGEAEPLYFRDVQFHSYVLNVLACIGMALEEVHPLISRSTYALAVNRGKEVLGMTCPLLECCLLTNADPVTGAAPKLFDALVGHVQQQQRTPPSPPHLPPTTGSPPTSSLATGTPPGCRPVVRDVTALPRLFFTLPDALLMSWEDPGLFWSQLPPQHLVQCFPPVAEAE